MADERDRGLRGRLTSGAEDALGKLAQDLIDNPLIHGAIRSAFDARERAAAAQEVAMGALNIPSASDLERLTRRLRSVSQRLEGIEDAVERVDRAVTRIVSTANSSVPAGEAASLEPRLAAIETQLAALGRTLSELSERLPGGGAPVSPSQERLQVDEPAPPARRRRGSAAAS
ncbi:MAG TPA: hypothetical protein VHX88_13760 [Solirubrobacteraceae bacterium]|jgi:uncharacterized coiled-coil protein SlyX|nr:hypothetical protein [Solirubrobacteraceae bacterium]